MLAETTGRGGVQVPLRAQASRRHDGEVLGAHRQRRRGVRAERELGQVSGAAGHRAEKFTLGPVDASTRARAHRRSSENQWDKRVRVNRDGILKVSGSSLIFVVQR